MNGGASWQPVFDTQGSFSIGWITLDPKRPNVVWVGTGERNSQRSVAYGDGVYKSEDGGRSWTNVGPQELRAHRPHRHRPERQRHGLRRRAGPAVGAGRRPRPLQDDRRRQDLDAGAEDLREHRRHRRGRRSAQSRRDRRVRLSAPPPFLHDDQRRAGERDPSQHRRRQDVEEGEHRAAGRTAGTDRPGDLAREPRRRSTPTSRRRTARAASFARPTTASPGRSAATTTRGRCTTATSSPTR